MGNQNITQAIIVSQAAPNPEQTSQLFALFDSSGNPVAVSPLYVATGEVILVGGTMTVADTHITANSKIKLFLKTPGGTVGAPFVLSITASTGFAVKSTSSTDTSTLTYEIESYKHIFIV